MWVGRSRASHPLFCAPLLYDAESGAVAQWLEQGTHNPSVEGSIPSGPTHFLGSCPLARSTVNSLRR